MAGTPIHLQLLGSNPIRMAECGERAFNLGSSSIDLNFGCPARTVNKNEGGAKLLVNCEKLYKLVKDIRDRLPSSIPLTAKIRLGYSDESQFLEIAKAIESAGASKLTVHGRTKLQAYRPPVNWDAIAEINSELKIPVVANGDIWTPSDFEKCRETTGCSSFMLGRGLVARPSLAREVKFGESAMSYIQLIPVLHCFINNSLVFRNERYAVQRTKQMLKLWGQTYPEFRLLFEKIKRSQDLKDLNSLLTAFCQNNHIKWSNIKTQSAWLSLDESKSLFNFEPIQHLVKTERLSDKTFRLQPKSLAKTSKEVLL